MFYKNIGKNSAHIRFGLRFTVVGTVDGRLRGIISAHRHLENVSRDGKCDCVVIISFVHSCLSGNLCTAMDTATGERKGQIGVIVKAECDGFAVVLLAEGAGKLINTLLCIAGIIIRICVIDGRSIILSTILMLLIVGDDVPSVGRTGACRCLTLRGTLCILGSLACSSMTSLVCRPGLPVC